MFLKSWSFYRLVLWLFLSAIGVLLSLATTAGYFDHMWWPFELAVHFRVQYLALLSFLALVFALGRKFLPATALLLFAVLNLAEVFSLYQGDTLVATPDWTPLRAMSAKALPANGNYGSIKKAVGERDPDFLLLLGIDREWHWKLPGLSESLPHIVSEPREDGFGIALLSKHLIQGYEIAKLGNANLPSLLGRVKVRGTSLAVLGIHTVFPAGAEPAGRRNSQLQGIPAYIRKVKSPLILLGNLNVTPWSWHFDSLLEETGLRNGSKGLGIQPTWPATFFPLLIPVDHCLYSTGIRIVSKGVGPYLGSDHYPVIVDFYKYR